MNITQYLRIVWARRWPAAAAFVAVSVIGIALAVLFIHPKYVARASIVFDARPDPVVMNPGWGTPSVDLGTQIEIVRSLRVAERAASIAGLTKDPKIVEAWRAGADESLPIEQFAAQFMLARLEIVPARGGNLVELAFWGDDAKSSAAGANAFAQAYLDVSVELRVAPARQYAEWFESQGSTLRTDLERAQRRLSQFQQERRIVGQDERIDEEIARLNILTAQLAEAQTQRAEAASRGAFSGNEFSLDVQQSPVVASLRAELARLEARLSEISNVVGTNHPQRIGLEAQVQETRRQITAEMRRVSGGTAASERAQARKVAELQSLVDQQRNKVLNMRGSRDELAVLLKDVENAQRAYEQVRTRIAELTLQGANMQANARILSPALEPSQPRSKRPAAMLASVAAGLFAAVALAFLLESLDPRVRGLEDLEASENNVPVIGVLRSQESRAPAHRRFSLGAPLASPPRLLGPGGRSGSGADA